MSETLMQLKGMIPEFAQNRLRISIYLQILALLLERAPYKEERTTFLLHLLSYRLMVQQRPDWMREDDEEGIDILPDEVTAFCIMDFAHLYSALLEILSNHQGKKDFMEKEINFLYSSQRSLQAKAALIYYIIHM